MSGDPLAPARGIIFGLGLSILVWMAVLAVAWWLL
jgi:hypothetical protein